MSVIHPHRHAGLIDLQRAVYAATEALYAYEGDDPESMREACRKAAETKETALYESGLVAEHGYFVAAQDLKQAAKS
jgi:ribulose-5-phosphate 4-epimerase/fuculose-1-phosphate aldolase